MNHQAIEKLQELLSDFLGPQLQEIVEIYAESSATSKYFVEIPETDTVDLGIEKVASLVARTSNV